MFDDTNRALRFNPPGEMTADVIRVGWSYIDQTGEDVEVARIVDAGPMVEFWLVGKAEPQRWKPETILVVTSIGPGPKAADWGLIPFIGWRLAVIVCILVASVLILCLMVFVGGLRLLNLM